MMTLDEFRQIGREQRFSRRALAVRAFAWLFGPIGLHSRIRAGHTLACIRRLDLPPAARVLDAGSGHGLTLFWLAQRRPGWQLRGIEIDPALVAEAQATAARMRLDSVAFEAGDLSALESVGGPYDLVFSIDVLEHIVDDVGVLRRLRRALRPDGSLVLHLPLRHQLQRRIFPVFKGHVVADHVRDEYTPEEIRAKLAETGFEVRDLRYGFGWPGELAFELNTLFWTVPPLRALLALATYPAAWLLAYFDIKWPPQAGNSLVVLAKPADGRES